MGQPLKILYVRNEDTAGTLSVFARGHRSLGNEARVVTLYPTAEGFEEDICLDLPLLPRNRLRRQVKEKVLASSATYEAARGYPPTWQPGKAASLFFRLRDGLWRGKVNRAIKEYGLMDFDIYHLEGGNGFFRMDPYPFQELKARGKHLLANYHGVDMRTRGVIPWIDDLVEINTTSELDLMEKHPNIQYVFLPYEVEKHAPRYELHDPIRICHATRDRFWKGSDLIIEACRKLESSHGVEFVLIENQPHDRTLELKSQCDIYIDQVANLGGWGYGMNSVEAFSMGLACCTNLVPQYESFLGDHPFHQIHGETLYADLRRLITNPDEIMRLKLAGRAWVERTHDLKAVLKQVYSLYQSQGWIEELPNELT